MPSWHPGTSGRAAGPSWHHMRLSQKRLLKSHPAAANTSAALFILHLPSPLPFTFYLIPYTLYLTFTLHLIPYTLYLIPYTSYLIPYTSYLVIPYTLPYLTLPYLTLPYLTLPYLTLPFTLPGGALRVAPLERQGLLRKLCKLQATKTSERQGLLRKFCKQPRHQLLIQPSPPPPPPPPPRNRGTAS